MRTLRFFSRYFPFFKHIRLLTYAFDGALLLWTFLTHPKIIDWIDEISDEVSRWENVVVDLHKFGGREFRIDKREIGHIHSNGVVDIAFPREMRNDLVKKARASAHHTFPDSGWVSIALSGASDVPRVLQLLRSSFQRVNEPTVVLIGNEQ